MLKRTFLEESNFLTSQKVLETKNGEINSNKSTEINDKTIPTHYNKFAQLTHIKICITSYIIKRVHMSLSPLDPKSFTQH